MKAINYALWIGAIVSTISTFVFLGDNSKNDISKFLFLGIINGVSWGWLIGLIINKIALKKDRKPVNKITRTPLSQREPPIADSPDRSEFRLLQQEFISNDNRKSLWCDKLQLISPSHFTTIFKTFVKNLVNEEIEMIEGSLRYKSFWYTTTHREFILEENRGNLIIISFDPYWLVDQSVHRDEFPLFIFHFNENYLVRRFYVWNNNPYGSESTLYRKNENELASFCGELKDSNVRTVYNYFEDNAPALLGTGYFPAPKLCKGKINDL